MAWAQLPAGDLVLEATRATWDLMSFHFEHIKFKNGNWKPLPGAEQKLSDKIVKYNVQVQNEKKISKPGVAAHILSWKGTHWKPYGADSQIQSFPSDGLAHHTYKWAVKCNSSSQFKWQQKGRIKLDTPGGIELTVVFWFMSNNIVLLIHQNAPAK